MTQRTPRTPRTPPDTAGRRWASRDAAAAYLGVSVRKMDYMIASGAVPAYRLPVQNPSRGGPGAHGGMVRLDLDELDAVLAAAPVTSARARTWT